MPKEFVKKYIDLLALHKMNVFHWHLTEDQGWRIEIKKYPEAHRGRRLAEGDDRRQADGDKPKSRGLRRRAPRRLLHAGRRSRDRRLRARPLRDRRARDRDARPRAWPPSPPTRSSAYRRQPFDVATRWGICENVLNAEERPIVFLRGRPDRSDRRSSPARSSTSAATRPPRSRWKASPRCRRGSRSWASTNEDELQSYFIRRMDKFLTAQGRRLIGWDEILEGGLAPGATVMSWRGEAAASPRRARSTTS